MLGGVAVRVWSGRCEDGGWREELRDAEKGEGGGRGGREVGTAVMQLMGESETVMLADAVGQWEEEDCRLISDTLPRSRSLLHTHRQLAPPIGSTDKPSTAHVICGSKSDEHSVQVEVAGILIPKFKSQCLFARHNWM